MRNLGSIVLALAVAGMLSACNNPDTVLFVTNSSLGINFDSKPATANIAYDRTEGYIAPRYPNGGAPPVAAQMETGGNIFNPIVRQSYVTGNASVIATGGKPDKEITTLEGDSDKKKLMFVGTATTVGLKVGFTGEVPDSMMFGYRRKEVSVIPVAETRQTDGTVKAVYPSVLATIDMNTKSTDPTSTGMTSKQFFATGQAADSLARNNPAISAAFKIKAAAAAMAGLTDDQRAEAAKISSTFLQTHGTESDAIVAYLTKDGPFTTDKLNALVDKAKAMGKPVPAWVGRVRSAEELKQALQYSPVVTDNLYAATRS